VLNIRQHNASFESSAVSFKRMLCRAMMVRGERAQDRIRESMSVGVEQLNN
jgi:hypothetical protein